MFDSEEVVFGQDNHNLFRESKIKTYYSLVADLLNNHGDGTGSSFTYDVFAKLVTFRLSFILHCDLMASLLPGTHFSK